MTPEVIIPLVWIGALFLTVEIRYSPRIGYTRERDVLLWYTEKNERRYINLFRI